MEFKKFKLKLVLSGIFLALFLAVVSPFLIVNGVFGWSEELSQGLLPVALFVAVIFLWNEFNKLRIEINKEELEDENLTELEHNVEKLTGEGPNTKNK